MNELVLVRRAEEVTELTLNRPERKNALSRRLLGELREALANQQAEGVRAVVLTGAGGVFSAGGDLADLKGTIDDLAVDEQIERTVVAIRAAHVPVIAAVEGPCIGAGLDLAMACDVRIASTSGYFQLPATRLGLLYNPRAVQRMRRALMPHTLARLLVLGERLCAEDALRAGIVCRVVGEGEAAAHAMTLARDSATNVPRAVKETKALLAALDDDDFDIAHWNDIRADILNSPERRKAVAKAKTRLGDP